MQHGLLCVCIVIQGVRGESSAARAALCLYSHTGSEGGVECSTGCSVSV